MLFLCPNSSAVKPGKIPIRAPKQAPTRAMDTANTAIESCPKKNRAHSAATEIGNTRESVPMRPSLSERIPAEARPPALNRESTETIRAAAAGEKPAST